MTDIERIERKLDLIIEAFGLGKGRRLAPCQIDDMVKNSVLKFKEKRLIKHGHDGAKS